MTNGPGPRVKRGDPITGFLGIGGPIGNKVLAQMPGSGWSANNRVAFSGKEEEEDEEEVQEDDGNEDWNDEESEEYEEEEDGGDDVDNYLDSSVEDSDDSNKVDY